MRKNSSVRATSLLLALVCLAGLPAVGQSPKKGGKNAPPAKTDAPCTGDPLSLQELMGFAKLGMERRMLVCLESRKIDFDPTPANLDQLKKAGASAKVLDAVAKTAPPKKAVEPPPKPKQTTALLTVLCAPAECTVQVNNGKEETTHNGRWERQDPPGTKIIDLKREGYVSEQREVKLAGGPATVSVTLKPNPATRQVFGKQVYDRMFQALGGTEAAARFLEPSTASGTIRIHAGGAPEEANLTLLVNGKLSSVRWNDGEAVLNCNGDQCKVDEKSGFLKKKKKAALEPETEKNVRAFRRFSWPAYIPSLLRQAKADLKPFADATEPDPDGKLTLVLQSDSDTYTLELGSDFLPHVILYHSRIPGMQADARIAYSGFQNKVPLQTSISFPGSKDAGIDVRFSKIEKGANLNAKDFPR